MSLKYRDMYLRNIYICAFVNSSSRKYLRWVKEREFSLNQEIFQTWPWLALFWPNLPLINLYQPLNNFYTSMSSFLWQIFCLVSQLWKFKIFYKCFIESVQSQGRKLWRHAGERGVEKRHIVYFERWRSWKIRTRNQNENLLRLFFTNLKNGGGSRKKIKTGVHNRQVFPTFLSIHRVWFVSQSL